MARYLPPTNGDERVLVACTKVWGSHRMTISSCYRMTRAAAELVEYGFSVTAQMEQAPSLVMASMGRPFWPDEQDIPEGSAVVSSNALMSSGEDFQLSWMREPWRRQNAQSLWDFLVDPVMGLAVHTHGSEGAAHDTFTLGNGCLWLTPIKHLNPRSDTNLVDEDLFESDEAAHWHKRPTFDRNYSRNNMYPGRAMPLMVRPSSGPMTIAPDNRWADGSAFEDWTQYDLSTAEMIQAIA